MKHKARVTLALSTDLHSAPSKCRLQMGDPSAMHGIYAKKGSPAGLPRTAQVRPLRNHFSYLITPRAFPTLMKASTHLSMWSFVCAALSCVRMRALPIGTTGWLKPMT
jgi:hypothetical protein